MFLSQLRVHASNALRHRSSILYVASLGASRLGSFFFALLALKVFDASNYAVYLKIFSVQPLVQILAGTGVNELLIPIIHNSENSSSQNKLDIAREHLLPMALLLLICLSIACPLLLTSIADNKSLAIVSISYVLYGISFFLLNAEGVYLNLSLDRSKASLFNLVNSIIVPGCALLFSSWQNNPFLYPFVLFIISVFWLLLLTLAYLLKVKKLRTPNGFRIANSHTARIFSYSLIGSIASWASGFGILYLASFLYRPFELQVYSAIFSLSSIPGVVSTLLNQSWTPYLYHSYESDSTKNSIRSSRSFYRYLSILMIVLIVAIALAFQSIIRNLLGITIVDNTFRFAFHSLALLSVSYLASTGWYFSQNYLYLLSKIRSLSLIQTVSSLVPFLLFFVGNKYVYLPSSIFFCQAFLRSLSAIYLNRLVVPFLPQFLETISPSLLLLSILFCASPALEYLYGK